MNGKRVNVQQGEKFGRWTVIEETTMTGRYVRRFRCKCDCGTEKVVRMSKLRYGQSRSCGCLSREMCIAMRKSEATHGLSGHHLHSVWNGMKQRCLNPHNPAYVNYGGRGISVCDEWMEFVPFYEWAVRDGYKRDLTLERKGNNKGYSPDNCTWATRQEQGNNTRQNVKVEYRAVTKTLTQWAHIVGMTPATLFYRVHRGWPTDKAFFTKPHYDTQVTIKGVTHTVAAWARLTGMNTSTLYMRIFRYNWPPDKAIEQEVYSGVS